MRKSSCTPEFWEAYRALPPSIRKATRKAYFLWSDNPRHPGLRFKCVDDELEIFSARINNKYRACCTFRGDECGWFFIGTHAEYEEIY